MTADTMTKDETIRLQTAEIEKLRMTIQSGQEINASLNTEIETLRALLRDILADQQTAHWHEDIKEALGE